MIMRHTTRQGEDSGKPMKLSSVLCLCIHVCFCSVCVSVWTEEETLRNREQNEVVKGGEREQRERVSSSKPHVTILLGKTGML